MVTLCSRPPAPFDLRKLAAGVVAIGARVEDPWLGTAPEKTGRLVPPFVDARERAAAAQVEAAARALGREARPS